VSDSFRCDAIVALSCRDITILNILFDQGGHEGQVGLGGQYGQDGLGGKGGLGGVVSTV